MIIYIKVRTSSGKQEIIRDGSNYTIYLKSPPENNRANVELIKLLHNYFKADVRIKSGFTSRNKIVEIKE